jgi:hypothetical protein
MNFTYLTPKGPATEVEVEAALSFARTLRYKPVCEGVGQLMLAFDGMDLVSAKALLWVVSLGS